MVFTKSAIVATIFLLVSLIYMIIGLYAVSNNKNNRINNIFFWMCLSLNIWSFCFSLITNASIQEAKLVDVLSKLSVLGWASFYPLIYHFFKVVVNNGRAISKKLMIMIYSPMLICWIGFGFLGDYSSKQFSMYVTQWGWTNVIPITPLNIFFIIYVLIFGSLALYNVYSRIVHEQDIYIKRRAGHIFAFYATITVLGIFWDIGLCRILHKPFIQITNVLLLLPILFMLYVFVKDEVIDKVVIDLDENVMDYFTKVRVFRLIGYMYVIFAYVTLYINEILLIHRLPYQIEISVFFIIVGIAHFFMTNLFVESNQIYKFMTVLAIMMFAFVFLRYQHDGIVIMWGVFFFYIFITSVFESVHYTILSGVTMIIIQFLYWKKAPSYYFYIDWIDYLGWSFLIAMTMVVIIFVNRIYRQKINESFGQMHMQSVFTELSKGVLEMHTDNVFEKTQQYMQFCNDNFGNKCTYYYLVDEDKSDISLYIYADNKGKKSPNRKLIFDNVLTLEDIKQKQSILVNNISSLDESEYNIKEYLREVQSDGFYAMVVRSDEKIVGILVYEFDQTNTNYIYHKYNKLLFNVVHDIINKLRYEEDIFYSANYDKITGIKNIDAFMREINHILETETIDYYAVLFIDIHNFKSINDAFGHCIGDDVLHMVATRISEVLTPSDIAARFSGDEFCVFLKNVESRSDVEQVVTHIISCFIKPISILSYDFKVNINIGVSVYPEDGDDITVMLKNADLAMHTSKKSGAMRYHFCDDADKKFIMERALYTNSLYNALANNEFLLAYQPQMDAKSEKVVGAEALIRWNSAKFGLVSPAKFISILENTGLIIPVGEWIMEQVAIHHKAMIKAGLPPMKLSVNLSVVQFQNIHLVESIKRILDKWDVDGAYYEFEITESAASDDSEFVVDSFMEIKSLGCHIAIDDFGVEFSSLNRLHMLPLDKLKIDQNFIRGIGIDTKKEAIVRFIIELSKSLGLTSIAEGVETKEQKEYIVNNSCDEIQGYYYAKPMPYEEFEKFVRDNL